MSASIRKFGFELEYASRADDMVGTLHDAGLMRTDSLHDYHCNCGDCSFEQSSEYVPERGHHHDCHCDNFGCWNDRGWHECNDEGEGDEDGEECPRRIRMRNFPPTTDPADLRAQRDSTANGEFITRPITDWDDFARIATALTGAANQTGATVNNRCGLHVHVDTSSDLDITRDERGQPVNSVPQREQRRRIVPAAYLAFERYFTEIVAPGASVRKRDMNSTLMQATRQYISDGYAGNGDHWLDVGRVEVDNILLQTIGRDRHVDLNWSRRHSTWEFRCFNATNAPWRIELACRLAVAFVEAAPSLRDAIESQVRGSKYWPLSCDSPWGEIIRPAWSELPTPHPTKKPVVPMTEFIDILCDVDPDLRPLIERQAAYMRARFATQIEVAS